MSFKFCLGTKNPNKIKEIHDILKDFNPEIISPIFLNKGNTSRYHICILPLMNHNYEQIEPTEVEKLQMKNSNIVLNISEIKNIIIYDLISRYTLDIFKQHYSLF